MITNDFINLTHKKQSNWGVIIVTSLEYIFTDKNISLLNKNKNAII